MEERFLKYPYRVKKWRLCRKIKIAVYIIVSLAFIEHLFFLTNSAFNQYQTVKSCNWTIDMPLNYFLQNQFGFVFATIPYSLPYGIFIELMNLSFTFGWNYMELFLMIISIGLATRFQQINYRLKDFRGKILDESLWIEIRSDYVVVCELLEMVDYKLRYLILLSNLNNLYFICFQLLNIYKYKLS
jgi:gustatory receptor